MSVQTQTVDVPPQINAGKLQLYKSIIFMAASALFVSASVIIYFNQSTSGEVTEGLSSRLYLFSTTITPYLISAAVAAMTAIGILAILPSARIYDPAQTLLLRLRELRHGDLSSKVALTHPQLKIIATELNDAVETLGTQLTTLKVLNRQQWKVLGQIRAAAEMHGCKEVLSHIDEMEQNWAKIAEVEERLVT
ncbi:hypothetical protein KQH82_11780 [bacterium]|nr:hypothetical protein [bacterium]